MNRTRITGKGYRRRRGNPRGYRSRMYLMNERKLPTVRGLKRGLIGVAGLAVLGAACGSSTHSTSGAGTSASSSAPSPSSSAPASSAAYTVSTQQVGSVGTVLVNGQGRTLYLLSSEKGGKLTCTDANGCTKYWFPVVLPSGVTKAVAGNGISGSLLSSVRSSSGELHVTYGGWPLYTFSGDSGSGSSSGVGVVSFGGTWYAVSITGNPTGSGGSAPTTTTGGSGGYGGGY